MGSSFPIFQPSWLHYTGCYKSMSSGTGVVPRVSLFGRQKRCYHHLRYWCILSPIKNSLSLVTLRHMEWELYCHIFRRKALRDLYTTLRAHLPSLRRKYSQLDKEGLAIIFAVKKFHQFLYGRPFLIKSDHKSLQYFFAHPSCSTLSIGKVTEMGPYSWSI